MTPQKIRIDLTADQCTQLQPLFDQITELNRLGQRPAVGAQIYPDGMVVTLLDEFKVRQVQIAITGGWLEGVYRTAQARMEAEPRATPEKTA